MTKNCCFFPPSLPHPVPVFLRNSSVSVNCSHVFKGGIPVTGRDTRRTESPTHPPQHSQPESLGGCATENRRPVPGSVMRLPLCYQNAPECVCTRLYRPGRPRPALRQPLQAGALFYWGEMAPTQLPVSEQWGHCPPTELGQPLTSSCTGARTRKAPMSCRCGQNAAGSSDTRHTGPPCPSQGQLPGWGLTHAGPTPGHLAATIASGAPRPQAPEPHTAQLLRLSWHQVIPWGPLGCRLGLCSSMKTEE